MSLSEWLLCGILVLMIWQQLWPSMSKLRGAWSVWRKRRKWAKRGQA